MMLLPSIFGENLFDDFLKDDWMFPSFTNDFFRTNSREPATTKPAPHLMKTDVRETETGYELDIDLPGYAKEDIKLELEDGTMTISASKNTNNDEKDENGRYIRRERYASSMSRSFYVGETIKPEDIHAKYENGVLKLSVPKEEPPKVEEKKPNYISIEG